MLTVKVKKSKWYRGKSYDSMLLLQNGNMCCIGFLARACKIKPVNIRGILTLDKVKGIEKNKLASRFINCINDAYCINDSAELTDYSRIIQLRKIGERVGIKFIFVP
jgi:hypothetical protein